MASRWLESYVPKYFNEQELPKFKQIERKERFGPFLLLHLVIATLGTLLITGVMSFLLSLLAGQHFVSLVALGPLFLLPIVSGVALGYAFATILPRYGATWVWVVPAVFLAINIAAALSNPYERRDIWLNEFGPQAHCTACLDETFVTVPLVGCIGYAIGAGVRRTQAA